MTKMIFKRFKILLLLLTASCCNEDDSQFCDTCNNFQDGFVIGFDPCTGVLKPNGGNVGFIIANPSKRDTVVAYNFPSGIYQFPDEYFIHYTFDCMFPDSAWNDFPVKIKYKYAEETEKHYPLCRGDILLYCFNKFIDNDNDQIVIIAITK